MPYEIRLKNNGTTVATRYYGFLTTADIYEACEKRFTDIALVKKCRFLVSDYSDVTGTDLHDVDVRLLALFYKNASSHNADVVAITILPRDLLYGLGRMWEAHLDGIAWTEKVVRTREEAQAFMDQIDAPE